MSLSECNFIMRGEIILTTGKTAHLDTLFPLFIFGHCLSESCSSLSFHCSSSYIRKDQVSSNCMAKANYICCYTFEKDME